MRDISLDGDGLRLHAVTVGEGRTLLFLHGFPEFWYAWKGQLEAFGPRCRAVALDLRGYNLSDKPPQVDDYALPRLVADVRAVLDALSPGQKAALVGHDWGGVVAWHFAAAHPEYLEKLVIINAPHPTIFARELRANPAQRRASSYIALFRSALAEPLLRAGDYALLAYILFGIALRPDAYTEEDRGAYRAAWHRPGALTGGLNYYRAIPFGTLTPGPPMIVNVPTLVLWGARDTALLEGSLDGLDEYVPDLIVERFPDASHWIVHEHPERVNRAISDFLELERT